MNKNQNIYRRIKVILETAQTAVARTVNTTHVIANWLIGREIVEEEQQGNKRASYGKNEIIELSNKLQLEFGSGYSMQNLFYMRQFYIIYPDLISEQIFHAVRGISSIKNTKEILHAVRGISDPINNDLYSPGKLNQNLSWVHYRTLLRVEKPEARSFYEIETSNNNWSGRELERQINSLLFERLALSKDKKALFKFATKGQEIEQPIDIIKGPFVIEFLRLPNSHKLLETQLEQALINDMQLFLLELGKGFAFISRQERITLDGDHNYIDLVFYHTILKCFILIDLKVGKLTSGDLGQLQVYVNYFDKERVSTGDNPTIGLILCTDKNDAVVKYFLGDKKNQRLFASKYKLYLPSEVELQGKITKELRHLSQKKTTKNNLSPFGKKSITDSKQNEQKSNKPLRKTNEKNKITKKSS
jgi:predicted nuclease of restriction endonuclease-like (RecB) superfamily